MYLLYKVYYTLFASIYEWYEYTRDEGGTRDRWGDKDRSVLLLCRTPRAPTISVSYCGHKPQSSG